MKSPTRPRVRLVAVVSVLVAGAAVACSLQEGGVEGLGPNSGDAASGSDGTTTGDASSNDGSPIRDAAPDQTAPGTDSGVDSGPPPRFIYANTNTAVYALELHSHVLTEVATLSGCGITAAFANADLAVDDNSLVHILAWSAPGDYRYYALEQDGGCVDVHGPGGTSETNMRDWFGYQHTSGFYVIASDTVGSRTIVTYDPVNSDFNTNFPNVFPANGATSDLACSPTLCYTALAHDHCPTDAGANDCLFAFTVNGGTQAQIGDFGKAGVVGMAYDSGYVYGFFGDGSVVKLSVAPGSTGQPFAYTGTAGLAWQGAGSSSANP